MKKFAYDLNFTDVRRLMLVSTIKERRHHFVLVKSGSTRVRVKILQCAKIRRGARRREHFPLACPIFFMRLLRRLRVPDGAYLLKCFNSKVFFFKSCLNVPSLEHHPKITKNNKFIGTGFVHYWFPKISRLFM